MIVVTLFYSFPAAVIMVYCNRKWKNSVAEIAVFSQGLFFTDSPIILHITAAAHPHSLLPASRNGKFIASPSSWYILCEACCEVFYIPMHSILCYCNCIEWSLPAYITGHAENVPCWLIYVPNIKNGFWWLACYNFSPTYSHSHFQKAVGRINVSIWRNSAWTRAVSVIWATYFMKYASRNGYLSNTAHGFFKYEVGLV